MRIDAPGFACEILGVTPSVRDIRPARRTKSVPIKTAPIAIPVFDENRHHLIHWVDRLAAGRGASVIASMTEEHARLRRVKNSARHERLADFLYHAVLAIEQGETAGARYILLTALAAFGWPSGFAEAV